LVAELAMEKIEARRRARPTVTCTDKGDDWLEYECGDVALSIEDGWARCLIFGTDIDIGRDGVNLRDLYTLLSDPRMQKWLDA
jgi:hypothetical protein